MHELSIALGILDAMSDEADRHGGASMIKAVHVRLGPLSGVVEKSLSAAYELARDGTEFAGCELVVEETPIILHCATCETDCPAESIQEISCSLCGSQDVSVVGGRELEVTALEIEA
ncbi:MAG TPA: hydrogenase maturation nickel metallochaperone HypA [Lacipirellulaceae bacterium]|jgi:hydrogenase nickel incorporation protein HypA/HybF